MYISLPFLCICPLSPSYLYSTRPSPPILFRISTGSLSLSASIGLMGIPTSGLTSDRTLTPFEAHILAMWPRSALKLYALSTIGRSFTPSPKAIARASSTVASPTPSLRRPSIILTIYLASRGSASDNNPDTSLILMSRLPSPWARATRYNVL